MCVYGHKQRMRPDAVAKGLYNIAIVAERWLCGEAYWLARGRKTLSLSRRAERVLVAERVTRLQGR